MLEATERSSVRGDIVIRVVEAATGRLVRRIEIRNLIVTNGLATIGYLLQGYTTPADTRSLSQLRVGTGSTAPVTGDTGIETDPGGTPVTCPVTTTVTVASNQVEVKCIATLETGQANGHEISEAGLFSLDSNDANPILFARQIFAGISKTSALEIQFDWRITFTA